MTGTCRAEVTSRAKDGKPKSCGKIGQLVLLRGLLTETPEILCKFHQEEFRKKFHWEIVATGD